MMASEVYREPVIGNWKPKRSERIKAKKSPADKRKNLPGNSEKHLAALRLCPCAMPGCNKVGKSDPHHIKSSGLRGMALKSPDRFAIPLCRSCHEDVERIGSKNELAFFEKRGLEALALADALWMVSPDKAAMCRVVLAHKQHLSEGK